MIGRPHPPRRGVRASRRSVPARVETLEGRQLLSGAAASGALLRAYGQIPMSFEANEGQTDARVRFLSRGAGYSLFVTPTEAVLSLQSPAATGTTPATPATGTALMMQLVGARATPRVTGLDPLPGTSNYLVGNDPSKWHTGIASFARVQEQGVYPGVNLVYYGDQRQLEYDFTVAPGVNPGVIRLSFKGAESTTLDAAGDLVLHTAGGDVVEHAPVLYQGSGGGRHAVSGHYVLRGDGRVGFAVGSYDRSRPLVIDPTLSYSTYLGGSGVSGNGIAVDAAGDAYVSGTAGSTDFPTTPGAFQTANPGGTDAFVTELNPAGSALVYSTYLGGSGNDSGSGIAVDAAGDAYVTGTAGSADFPTTPGAFQTAGGGGAFVTKLNPAGSALVYSTYLGGGGGSGIAVDAAGDAYVTGSTKSANFPTTPGAFQTAFLGGTDFFHGFFDFFPDAFVTELNPAGSAPVYSTYLGGYSAAGSGIAVDAAGDAYVTGQALSDDFPTTPGAFQTAGFFDAFVTELNPAGSALVYSTYLGSVGSYPFTSGSGIAVDAAGDAYVTGSAGGGFPTTPGAFQTAGGGAFVTKLNPAGSALVYSTYLGGGGSGIAVDAAGDAYVTGSAGGGFPTTPGAFQTAFRGTQNAFVTELNPAGSALVYSTYLGGSGNDSGSGIAVDAAGDAYVTGTAGSADFPTTPGAFQTAFGGGDADAFVTKFALGQATTTALSSSPSPSTIGQAVTFTATVTEPPGPTGMPTGTVTFLDGTTTLLAVPLDAAGHASFSTAALGVGTHTIIAMYSGGNLFAGSNGVAVLTVNRAATTTVVTTSPSPSTLSRAITFTATVTEPPGSIGTPTGTVTFREGTTALRTVPLDAAGHASLTIAAPHVGPLAITALYGGDDSSSASSATVFLTIGRLATTAVVTASPALSTVGRAVSITATVTQPAGPAGTPTRTFTFLDGTTILLVVPVDTRGRASFTTTKLGTGTHTITAVYSGGANFLPSTATTALTVIAATAPTVAGLVRLGPDTHPTALVLTFDLPLAPATARDRRNYRLADPRGHLVALRSVSYDPVAQTVTLIPSRRLDIRLGYRLTVIGTGPRGVRGADGLLLDGSGAGRPGTDYHAAIDGSTPVVA